MVYCFSQSLICLHQARTFAQMLGSRCAVSCSVVFLISCVCAKIEEVVQRELNQVECFTSCLHRRSLALDLDPDKSKPKSRP